MGPVAEWNILQKPDTKHEKQLHFFSQRDLQLIDLGHWENQNGEILSNINCTGNIGLGVDVVADPCISSFPFDPEKRYWSAREKRRHHERECYSGSEAPDCPTRNSKGPAGEDSD